MDKNTIEILLLFGIVFVSLAIIVLFGRRYAARLDAEGFQGVARGGATPINRDVYDRPVRNKETRAQNQYTQGRYSQTTQNVTNARVKFIRIDGKNDWLYFSQIAVYDLGGTNVAPSATPTSSGTHRDCHDHHHHGRHYDWRKVRHFDNGGCHTMRMSSAIDGNLNSPENRWWDWGNDGEEGQTGGIYHSSSWSGPWFELSLRDEIYVREIKIWQRYDNNGSALGGFKLKLLSANRTVIQEHTLGGSDRIQTYAGPALNSCPGGFRKEGDNYSTTCRQNCAAGETADNANLICYRPCNSGDYLEGGTGGTCKTPCASGFTLGGNTCFRDCVAPEADAGGNRCYVACAAGEDASRFPRCHKPCETTAGAGAAYRLIEDRCFPRDPFTYLPIAWTGPIISQADTVENIGLCLPLGQKNGDRAGIWGSVPTTSSDTSWDVVWAYTEDMELVNMNNRKCLDTAFLQSTPTVWDCNGGQQQKWFVDSEGRIRSKQYPDRCLTTDTANGYVEGNPLRLNKSRAIDLQPCTNDGSKFQRWRIPAARVGINQAVAPAAGPPALPSEPIIRDAFTDGSGGGSDSKPLAARLAERVTEDAF